MWWIRYKLIIDCDILDFVGVLFVAADYCAVLCELLGSNLLKDGF